MQHIHPTKPIPFSRAGISGTGSAPSNDVNGAAVSSSSQQPRVAPGVSPPKESEILNSNWSSSPIDKDQLKILSHRGQKGGDIVRAFSQEILGIDNDNNLSAQDQQAKLKNIIDKYIISAKVHVDAKLDGTSGTILYLLTAKGYPEIVKYLVKMEADLNISADMGDTPLHKAIRSGGIFEKQTLEDIDTLIQGGANLNAKNKYGDTPLDLALKTILSISTKFNDSTIEKINKLTARGECNLIIEKHKAFLENAIENKEYYNETYNERYPEFIKHIYNYISDQKCIPPFFDISNNKIDVPNYFEHVNKILMDHTEKSKKEDRLQLLIEDIKNQKMDINARNPHTGQTLLIAIADKYPKIALTLIDLNYPNIDLTATDDSGYNALHKTVENENWTEEAAVIRLIKLLKNTATGGVDVNAQLRNHDTALHLALKTALSKDPIDSKKALERIEALFPEANLHHQGSNGSPIDRINKEINQYAPQDTDPRLGRICKIRDKLQEKLMQPADVSSFQSSTPMVEEMPSISETINIETHAVTEPLKNKTIVSNFFQQVRTILDSQETESQKENQLRRLIDEYIISNKIDINARDPKTGATLLIAMADKHPEVALYLMNLDRGIDCFATDDLGYNALHKSVKNNNLIPSEENEEEEEDKTILLITKLKEEGIDVNIHTYNKYTALHLALKTISRSIINNKCDLSKAFQRLEALFPEVNFSQKESIGNPIDILSQAISKCEDTRQINKLKRTMDWLKPKILLTVDDVKEKLSRGDKDFEGANLEGLDLSGKDIIFGEGFNFKNANMKGVIFRKNSEIKNSNFTGAQLQGATMENMTLVGNDFTNAKMHNIKLSVSNMSKSNLTNTEMQSSELVKTNLSSVYHKCSPPNLANANARESIWRNSQLDYLYAPGIDLTEADFSGSEIIPSWTYANLQGSTGCGAKFKGANFTWVNISSHFDWEKKSNWEGAYLPVLMVNVDATNANLSRCNANSVHFTGANLTNTDLSNLKSCTNIIFDGTILNKTNLQGNYDLRKAIKKGGWPDTTIKLNEADFKNAIFEKD